MDALAATRWLGRKEVGTGWSPHPSAGPGCVFQCVVLCEHVHMCVVGPLPSAASVYSSRVMQGFAQREETAVGKQLRRAGRQTMGLTGQGRRQGQRGLVHGEGPVYRLSQGPVLRAVSMGTARTRDPSLLTEKLETVLFCEREQQRHREVRSLTQEHTAGAGAQI